MMKIITDIHEMDCAAWSKLVAESSTGTWFQTPEAYDFFAAQPELFRPFVLAVERGAGSEERLVGVCVGYETMERNPLKQLVTCRAIIIGGPALRNDCSSDEVQMLMDNVRTTLNERVIYVETRNFNDYSRWRDGFAMAGFEYEPHLNLQIATESFAGSRGVGSGGVINYAAVTAGLMGKNRVRDIRFSFRDGAVVIDHPSMEQVRSFYNILKHLYATRVKTPLFPWSFFEQLYHHPDSRFILVSLHGEIVGGTVCVVQKNKSMYEWFVAGRDGEWKSVFPSSVATYAGIRYAAEYAMPRFDMMGAGKPGDAYGVRDFKARFGGEMVEHGRFICVLNPILYKCGSIGVNIIKKLK